MAIKGETDKARQARRARNAKKRESRRVKNARKTRASWTRPKSSRERSRGIKR